MDRFFEKREVDDVGGTSSIYYHLDHLGTPTGNSNAAGSLTAYATPDSYGNGSFEFTGREYDSFTELYYYRARMYDPKLGRFISEDPIGFAGGDVNLFGYVGNAPIHSRDPLGLYDPADYEVAKEMIRQAPKAGPSGIALLIAGGKVALVAGGGLAAGYAIGYYPGHGRQTVPIIPLFTDHGIHLGHRTIHLPDPCLNRYPKLQARNQKRLANLLPIRGRSIVYRPIQARLTSPKKIVIAIFVEGCFHFALETRANQSGIRNSMVNERTAGRVIENVVSTVGHGRLRNVQIRGFRSNEKE